MPSLYNFIQTHSGKRFDFGNINPDAIDILDIAHALSNLARFGGHLDVFYSVADHSVSVSNWLQDHDANTETIFLGLIHDASESYAADVVTPLKRLLPNYHKIEKEIQNAVLKHFKVDESQVNWNLVREADRVMLVSEVRDFFKHPPLEDWTKQFDVEPYDKKLHAHPPHLSRIVFLSRFKALQLKRNNNGTKELSDGSGECGVQPPAREG